MAGNRSRKPGHGNTWGFDSSSLRHLSPVQNACLSGRIATKGKTHVVNRRLFFSSLAGLVAGGGLVKDVVVHRVLRRPYREHAEIPARPYMLCDVLWIWAEYRAPLRIKVIQDGAQEPMVETTVVPRSGEAFAIMGVHQARAERSARVEITSTQKFKLLGCSISFMHPPFHREDGMVVYHDPFYKPRPEREVFGTDQSLIHRLMPGADVRYAGGGEHGPVTDA